MNTYMDLELSEGRKLKEVLEGYQIDDDDEITLLIIVNNNPSSHHFANCILIDKDGSTTIYRPEISSDMEKERLSVCFDMVCDYGNDAMSHFAPLIKAALEEQNKQ